MSTKAELEAEIAALKAKIDEQRRALDLLGEDQGVAVAFPWADHGLMRGDTPYIPQDGDFGQKVVLVAAQAIRQHGVNFKHFGGCTVDGDMSLRDSGFSQGDHYLVPKLFADLLASILDASADFANAAYKKGVADGSHLLGRLTSNEITVDEFDGSLEHEKARTTQQHKTFTAQRRTRERSK